MVGSVLHRHDNVHRQLAAFTELLRRVQAHYANDQLRQMLYAICVDDPNVPRRPRQLRNHRTDADTQQRACDVTSLSQLRCLVKELKSGRSRYGVLQREKRRKIINYFERFFDDLERLRELKRYFHERIYACLYEHYYKPDKDESSSRTSTVVSDVRVGSGRPLATVLDQSDNDAPSSLDGRPLSEIVHQLWILNRDWDGVLSEEDNNVVEIDEEPQTDEKRFVRITSIVSNWVEFGFRALQLAKIWWTTANRLYGGRSPTDDETVEGNGSDTVQSSYMEKDEENDEVASLAEEVATLNDCSYQICVELDSLREELKQVRMHGERVETLYKKLKEVKKDGRIG